MVSKPKPSRPFQQIAVDFCSYGRHQFLIIVDCFTDWPEIIPMRKNTSTQYLVQALTELFCQTAIPDVVWSDGGPQFTSKHFSDFATQWGFEHKTPSPHYPQSNGKIEATVKSMKKIIALCWGNRSMNVNIMCRALLQYWNTLSRKDGQSPAQKLFGRPIQNTLPAHHRSFAAEWQCTTLEAEQLADRTSTQTEVYYNKHAQDLQDIKVGSTVALQNPRTKLWDIYGAVVNVSPHRRYLVKIRAGRVLVQNRRFLRCCSPASTITRAGGSMQPPTLTQPAGRVPRSNIPHSSSPETPVQHQQTLPPQELRRSERTSRPPQRLIEDPQWPWDQHGYPLDHTKLGGGCKNSNCRCIIDYYTAPHMHLRTHSVTLAHVILVWLYMVVIAKLSREICCLLPHVGKFPTLSIRRSTETFLCVKAKSMEAIWEL